jgi:hypothetical protein
MRLLSRWSLYSRRLPTRWRLRRRRLSTRWRLETWEQQPIIKPVGDHGWEDANWNGQGHRTMVNRDLDTMCRYLYPWMVFVCNREDYGSF